MNFKFAGEPLGEETIEEIARNWGMGPLTNEMNDNYTKGGTWKDIVEEYFQKKSN